MQQPSLEERVAPQSRKADLVDRGGSITYSLLVGAALDYSAGLDLLAMLTSRGSSIAINFATGGSYGRWREKMYHTTNTSENSPYVRKLATDLLAFNTF